MPNLMALAHMSDVGATATPGAIAVALTGEAAEGEETDTAAVAGPHAVRCRRGAWRNLPVSADSVMRCAS